MQDILNSGMELIAPVADGGYSAFEKIVAPEQARLDLHIARMSLKQHFFPVTECILKYSREGIETKIQDVEPGGMQRVVFGARPCDAAALDVMDKVFTWDYMDNFYLDRRKNTTIVTIACDETGPQCRCGSVGLSRFSKNGSDVLLFPISGDKFVIEPQNEKGEKLLGLWKDKVTDAEDAEAAEAEKKRSDAKVAAAESIKPGTAVFDSPHWDSLTMKCLGCGVCAYLCPTCHCFDIVDEKDYDSGERRKNWDACAFELFTMHGSLHNPRAAQWQRYRQRVMHKFSYYPEKFGAISCVGCGRCLTACPVGMDIFEVLERVSADER